MKIKKQLNGTELTISLSGALDTENAPKLEEVMNESLTGVTSLIIDLKDLEYISSSGLRVLLMASKTMNRQGTMVVKNPNEVVSEVFEFTGFNDILTIA